MFEMFSDLSGGSLMNFLSLSPGPGSMFSKRVVWVTVDGRARAARRARPPSALPIKSKTETRSPPSISFSQDDCQPCLNTFELCI